LHQTDRVRRPLDDREHELFIHMIGFADRRYRDALLRQADSAVVTGSCGCGCPAVDLDVAQERARRIERRRTILAASWMLTDDRYRGGTELPPSAEVVPSVQQA